MSVLSRIRFAAPVFAPPRQLVSRSYGSAVAAAQLDYDYYYSYDDDEELQRKTNRRAMEESGWETVGRGVQWVVMGDPMVRRHVYAERLAKLLDVPHISMGSLVRQELNPNTPLYKKIASAVNQGNLVSEDVIFALLSKRLEEGYSRGETGFILDGIPRTRTQAEILDQIADIDLVLNLKSSEESVVKKSLNSGIYSPSREFLRLCTEQRKPLEEYYRRQRMLLDFKVAGAPGETWQSLLAALQLQHMSAVASAANSSQKLTA